MANDWFSVPYGISRDGKPLIATVALSHPLKHGHLRVIAQQILVIAEMAEETVEEAPDFTSQAMLKGISDTIEPTAAPGGEGGEG